MGHLPNIGVLGPGRFGLALTCSLRELGYSVSVRGRDDAEPLSDWCARADVLCLTVRDTQLQAVAAELSDLDLTNKTVLTHSGATPLSVLTPLAEQGAIIGKFHPLQAFTQAVEQPIPAGTPFAIQGQIETLVAPWVAAWSGSLYRLSTDQWAVYHLAAVVAANFLPLFVRSGAALLEPMARNEQDALNWLKPLVMHSIEGAFDAENPLPFSGPAVRGDLAVQDAHRALLAADQRTELAELYRVCSQMIGDLAGKGESPPIPRP